MPERSTTIRMYGCLHTFRKDRGLESVAQYDIPDEGCPASRIARDLDLPFEKIEGVFVNNIVRDIDHVVFPGDEIAFIPTGVPGPHRFILGILRAGQKAGERGGV